MIYYDKCLEHYLTHNAIQSVYYYVNVNYMKNYTPSHILYVCVCVCNYIM